MAQQLICESCECGYAPTLLHCSHCGCGAHLAHIADKPHRRCDTECYPDYWLCQFDNPPQSFQLFPGHPLDRVGLKQALSTCVVVTFNGNKYDMPMIEAALGGATNADLKVLNDRMIVGGERVWHRMRWIDTIDLIEVKPGDGGLKAIMGTMHAPTIQDLPIDPSESVDWPKRALLREYCYNDLTGTALLEQTMSAQLKLREEMSADIGVDLRSKSDAQIAEAVMKATLGFKPEVPSVPPGTAFQYRAPDWVEFVYLDLLDVLRDTWFVVGDNYKVAIPGTIAGRLIRIAGSAYRMGNGGLHSTEQQRTIRTAPGYSLQDADVTGYYPESIRITGIYPKQIGPRFAEIYSGWIDERTKAKRAGNTKKANSLKIVNNGTFGKLGDRFSIFYAPSELIQVTLTGQLALLMLIERLEMCGVRVVSANTDGICTYCHDSLREMRTSVIAWWEKRTGYTMEYTDYTMIANQSVNSYVAITTKGKVKQKGAFAPPEPGPSGWPNPTTQVCVDAVVAYLRDGTHPAATVLSCQDVRQFVSVRKVDGGGTWQGDYLGKIVRWYYAKGGAPIVARKTGNKVAKTDGCRPMMTLTNGVPADLDYGWYVQEAKNLLDSMGIPL